MLWYGKEVADVLRQLNSTSDWLSSTVAQERLEARDWLLAAVIASTILFAEEIRKAIHRFLMRPKYVGTNSFKQMPKQS